jgi:hypothetical protein
MPRWSLIVFAAIVAFAIWHDVSSDLEKKDARTGPATMEQDRISQMEAAASVLAKAQAGAAFATGQRACGDPSSAACSGSARNAAYETARSVLMNGGCITWETSAWDPRAMRERDRQVTHAEAEAACEQQAHAIVERVAADAAPHSP